MHGERRGEPLRLHQDVSATRLPGGLETTLQVTRASPFVGSKVVKIIMDPDTVFSALFFTPGVTFKS